MKNKIHLLVALNHFLAAIGLYFLTPRFLWFSLVGWLLFGKIGGEIGYHRYFAHRSFSTNKFFERMFIIFGSLNCFGPPLSWVGVHRKHHQFADQSRDPHGDQAFWRVWLTLWGYFRIEPRSLVDLLRDPWQRFFNDYYFILIAGSMVALATVHPLLPVYLISIPAVVTFHSAGMVNSICHMFGYRRFQTEDHSYNNLFVNFVTLGSGLHNNHHARPLEYSNSCAWYEIDLPGWLIHKLFNREFAE